MQASTKRLSTHVAGASSPTHAPRHRPQALALVAALALAGPATADVAPATDLQQACPDAPAQLDRELAPALRTWGQAGTLDVVLRWDGTRATLLQASGGPATYRSALRQAVRTLHCPGLRAGDPLRFRLRFAPDDDGR